jgi:hypothetical protein
VEAGLVFERVVALLVLALAPHVACAAGTSTVQQQYDALLALDDTLLQAGTSYDTRRLAERYDRAIAPSLSSLPDADLDIAFRAAHLVAMRTHDAAHVARMRAALDEMRRRSPAPDTHDVRMVAMYLSQRDWARAAALNATLPDADKVAVPNLTEVRPLPPGPTLLALRGERGEWTLERRPLDLSGKRVVILASPACSFSNRFFDDVQKNPELSGYVKDSLIVLPQTLNLLLDEAGDWNMRHPAYAMSYVYAASDWPAIDWWGTPTVYFFEDGTLQRKLVGWQPGVAQARLLDEYRRWWPRDAHAAPSAVAVRWQPPRP